MKLVIGANLALRFLLELTALTAVGYWGWKTGDGALGWVLAVAAVLRSSSESGCWPGLRCTRPTAPRLH
jgi:hypothetical protein